jgi:uncharacterized OB-fold protein
MTFLWMEGDDSRNREAAEPCKKCGSVYASWPEYVIYMVLSGRFAGLCHDCADDAELQRRRDRRRQARADRTCERKQCGVIFTPGRADGKFCSNACRQRAYRERYRNEIAKRWGSA